MLGGGCVTVGPAPAGLVKGACDVLTVVSAASKRRVKWRVRGTEHKGRGTHGGGFYLVARASCRAAAPIKNTHSGLRRQFDGRRRAGGSTSSTHTAEELSAHVFAVSSL